MSLQVCHCGWTKVTTYHGLRIHQGKMGCKPRGAKVEESELQYMWENEGLTNNQNDLMLDVYAYNKPDTGDWRVCHCGWSKETTYRGLRIHQGKMGCTPKGVRIPEREQYIWASQRVKEDQRKHQPAKRMTAKKENAPLPPSTNVHTNYAATNKEEYKSSTNSKSRRKLFDFSTDVQVRQDRITADLQHKAQMRGQGRSSVKAYKGSLDAEWLEINSVFSEVERVVKDAKQKSPDLSFSISTLGATASIMMEQIHQEMEKLSSIELKWIPKFAVDVKLDPTTPHGCVVSANGKKASNRRENQEAWGRFGSILGLNRLTSGKSYWEVVVSNKTRWDLGVARRDANCKGKLSLSPDNGYWVTPHYENEKYALLTKPEKVGVVVDYEEGLVSFYDVTAQSHMYSFTECSLTGAIYPYFSLQLKEGGASADPLIISTVKDQ